MTPRSLNHIAYPTWDSAATYRFYTEVLGCPFVTALQLDRVASSGEPAPFLHTFYGLGDGSCIAFFEVEGLAPATPDGVPSWLRHIALDVETEAELHEWRERFIDHDVEPVGIVDHEGTWLSLYVFDPNGVRIELTYQARELDGADLESGLIELQQWCERRGHDLPDLPDVSVARPAAAVTS